MDNLRTFLNISSFYRNFFFLPKYVYKRENFYFLALAFNFRWLPNKDAWYFLCYKNKKSGFIRIYFK